MLFFQFVIAGFVFLLLFLFLLLILKKFNRKDLFPYLFLPVVLFTTGFYMRLNSNSKIIDLGFFFTEISSIWLYVLFVLALLLGQIKYWKR